MPSTVHFHDFRHSAGLCSSASNGSSFYAILVPDDGAGTFKDSLIGNVPNCDSLWNYINWGLPIEDIAAVYSADPDSNETVGCSDSGGCTFTSFNCFSGWGSANHAPTGTAASLAASGGGGVAYKLFKKFEALAGVDVAKDFFALALTVH